jgi:superfamily I DNA/RNA helicase
MSLKPIILKGEQKRVLFLQVTDPIQIKGVAGSGKTTVALYRAKHLLDTQSNLFQEAKVAIFTYNKTLVKYINAITPHISGGYQSDSEEIRPTKPKGINVFVTSFHKWAYHFIEQNGIQLSKVVENRRVFKTISGVVQNNIVSTIKVKYATQNIANKTVDFFAEEISWMKGKAFKTKEEYFDAKRAGRGTNDRVTKVDKETIWNIYTEYNNQLKLNDQVDFDDYALLCLKIIASNPNLSKPFTHIIVDEAQDLSKAQILVISQIVSDETKSISIIADAAQRIYKSGFTWSEAGLNVRGGRTIEFKKNYRNTIQIVNAALSLLEKEDDKSDFTTVETARKGEDKPIAGYFSNWSEQCSYILSQLNNLKSSGNINSTVILHRSHSGIRSIKDFLENNNFEVQELLKTDDIDFESDSIKVCTLSSVKGLEFENVFIIDLNDDVIPYPPGFNDSEDEFHISTERRLLYTSMTRARERLFLLSSGKASRYLSEIDEKFLQKVGKITNPPQPKFDDDLPF